MSFVKLFCSIFLAFFLSQATGQPSDLSHGNPGQTAVPGHYNPQVFYETYGSGTELPFALSRGTVKDVAVSFAMHKLGLSNNQVTHRAGFSSDITDHTYLNQVHNGIPFVNAVANVAIKDGKVVAFGSSFVKTDNIAPPNPSVNKKDAITAAESALKCTYDSRPVALHYLVNAGGSVSLVYVISVNNEESGEWYEAHVDAHSAKLLSTVNYVAHATYTAVPITHNSILDGQSVLVDPQDMLASPNGWHRDAQQFYNITRGNNGYASHGNHSASESSNGAYDYGYDTQLGPDGGNNQDAAIVNAFYLMNKVHDFTYRYGFNEGAFNFQMNNFNRGGEENDGVIISVNNRTKFNNAGFSTPADGRSGTCNLYLFTYTKPLRSSAMDNSVVVHELGHGVSNRLVGGGTATCLTSIVNRGLGEGWSDMLADWTEQTSAITKDFTIGTYVVADRDGLRRYPYSTNATVNPLKYSDVAKSSDSQHNIGEVWANMLHNVYAALVAQHGYAQDAMTNPFGRAGNVVFMHLFIDSLSLLPCYPDFIAARDGFIQADGNRYDCRHVCLIWKAFARHGLGVDAHGTTDGFKVPSHCYDSEA